MTNLHVLQTKLNGDNPINQTERYRETSDRYKLIRTDKVIEVFQDNGLSVVDTSFAKTRDKEREGFQKHMVIFSADNLKTNDGQLQLLLTNSHDGSSSYQLDLGFFRRVCANGIIDGQTESTVRIRHTGRALDRLDEAVRYQLDRLPLIAAKIDAMSNVDLNTFDQLLLTRLAAELRIGKDNIGFVERVQPIRPEDAKNDLWTVFNRVQEKVIRGGLQYTDNNDNYKKTRKITSINSVIKLNKGLWNIAENFLKAA